MRIRPKSERTKRFPNIEPQECNGELDFKTLPIAAGARTKRVCATLQRYFVLNGARSRLGSRGNQRCLARV